MDKASTKLISLKVFRGNLESNRLVTYQVPYKEGSSVLNALQYIGDHLDPGLAFSASCRIGLCSSCMVRVNGKAVMSCSTLVEDGMVIEPFQADKVLRDLVVQLPEVVKREPAG